MALAEGRIARAIAALDALAARGIDSCRAATLDALRQATFATIPVKELSIVAADGRTLCTDLGNQPEQRKLDLLRAGCGRAATCCSKSCGSATGRSTWSGIRRPGAGTANGLAALIPAELFVAAGFHRGRAAELPRPHADRAAAR